MKKGLFMFRCGLCLLANRITDKCQGSCRFLLKNYADFLLVNLSGLRLTFGIQFQFRVSPLQRNGFTSFAI
jgi:hypothetical protein